MANQTSPGHSKADVTLSKYLNAPNTRIGTTKQPALPLLAMGANTRIGQHEDRTDTFHVKLALLLHIRIFC